MAVPNGLNPDFLGPVTARGGFKTGNGKGIMITAVSTASSAPVSFFGASATDAVGQYFTITGIFVVAKDASTATITIAGTQGTVATIAKGATAGALVGATSLSNTALVPTDTFTIVSNGPNVGQGDAFVYITFKPT